MTEIGKPGSPEHAADLTTGRHPGVQDAMQWLAFSHLPESLRRFSRPIYNAAQDLLRDIPNDGPELTTALNTLVTAKDHMMRAGIRSDQGKAGSVPRPQEVADPPQLAVDHDLAHPAGNPYNCPCGQEDDPATRITQVGAVVQPIHHYDDPEA